MIVTRKELVESRLTLVKQMNDYILKNGDEKALEMWFMVGVPDCPTEEDFEFFAEDDEEWTDLCKVFGALVR